MMNSYLLNQVLDEARKLQPKQLNYLTELKTVMVLADFEYEHKFYSAHRYEKGVGPDYLQMPPSHAKEYSLGKGLVSVCRGGAADIFLIGKCRAYRPWRTDVEEAGAVQAGPENIWLRCRLTKFVSIIPGFADGGRELLGTDIYLQWGFLKGLGAFSLEGENQVMAYGAIEIAVPQALEAAHT